MGLVRVAVVLRVVQGVFELPVAVMAGELPDMSAGMGFVVVRCRSPGKSW